MIFVETCRNASEPVDCLLLSTAFVHRPIPVGKPVCSVFPVIHTPYDFYERI
jgi:hypothetical protein